MLENKMATRQVVPSILASLLLVVFMAETYYRRPVSPEKSKTLSVTRSSIGPVESGQLIFSEEFDHVNLSLWQPIITMSGCGSGEFQIYDKNQENIFVKDGVLHIQPTLTADKYGEDFLYNGNLVMEGCTDPLFSGCNKTAGGGYILNPVISARLRTLQTFSFMYGRVEARAKIPSGDWIWPAIWMNPRDMVYGTWPMSGEIDIMESRGNNYLYDGDWTNVGNRQVQASLHFGPDRTQDKWRLAHGSKNSYRGFDQQFHRYQLEWTPEYMAWMVFGWFDISDTSWYTLNGQYSKILRLPEVVTNMLSIMDGWMVGSIQPSKPSILTLRYTKKCQKCQTIRKPSMPSLNFCHTQFNRLTTLGVDDEILAVVKPPKDGGMYALGQFTGPNIWENASNPVMAPFDQQFYFIINVAVGGTRGFFSDSSINIPYEKPWKNSDSMETAMLKFWNERSSWLPTWDQGASALKIDYIRVWAL